MPLYLDQKRFFVDPVDDDFIHDSVSSVGKKKIDDIRDILRQDHALVR